MKRKKIHIKIKDEKTDVTTESDIIQRVVRKYFKKLLLITRIQRNTGN